MAGITKEGEGVSQRDIEYAHIFINKVIINEGGDEQSHIVRSDSLDFDTMAEILHKATRYEYYPVSGQFEVEWQGQPGETSTRLVCRREGKGLDATIDRDRVGEKEESHEIFRLEDVLYFEERFHDGGWYGGFAFEDSTQRVWISNDGSLFVYRDSLNDSLIRSFRR